VFPLLFLYIGISLGDTLAVRVSPIADTVRTIAASSARPVEFCATLVWLSVIFALFD